MKNCFISVTYFDLHSLQFTTSSKELHVSVHSIKECDYKRVLMSTRGGSPPHRPVYIKKEDVPFGPFRSTRSNEALNA